MKRLLIDTDTASDDAIAILFGVLWPHVSVEAITVVAGNVVLDQAVENALYTLEVADRAGIPVFPGADRPLLRSLITAEYVHGQDGMGNAHFPKADQRPEAIHAVDAILAMANRWSGELEIVAQAPLTNLALALCKDPELPRKIKHLWIMGGANNHIGNISPAAEFNFYVDPEAAHRVLQAGFEVTLIPWDVILKDGILMRQDLEAIETMGTTLSQFYLSIHQQVWAFQQQVQGGGIDGVTNPDPLAMAIALNPDLIQAHDRWFVAVEYQSELTRGYSLIDQFHVLNRDPNATVVTRVHRSIFLEMLTTLLQKH